MKRAVLPILLLLFVGCSVLKAQSLTKEQALDALQQTLKGQMNHYHYGGPCEGSASSNIWASGITIKAVKFEYSQIIIEYSYESDGKERNNVKRINMNNHFVSYSNAIFESKDDMSTGSCDKFVNRALTFSEDAKAGQERCLKILSYLRQFAEKDPFDN